MTDSKITVALADDHQIILEGLCMVLSEHPGIHVTGTATSAEDLLALVDANPPEIAVVDISFPSGMDGITATMELTKRHPEVKVLILTMHMEKAKLHEAIQAGAKGFLPKNQSGKELLMALEALHNGHNYFSKELGQVMIDDLLRQAQAIQSQPQQLTDAETEVLNLVAEGLSSKLIADKLHRSIHTVNTHRKNIIAKLKVTNIHEAISWARKNGIMN